MRRENNRIQHVISGLLLFAAVVAWGRTAEARDRWIVVTAPGLRQAIEPLCKHRANEGFEVTEIATSDVLSADQIARGDGQKLRERLNKLCADATGKSYVLLVGVPFAAKGADAQATVIPALVGTISRMKNQPSDNAYGCLGADRQPTIAVGRLPARNSDEAGKMVSKIIAFENGAASAAWRRSVTMLVGNPGGHNPAQKMLADWYIDYLCQTYLENLDPSWNVRTLCHIPGSPWSVPDKNLHDKSIEYLEQGQAFAMYIGHSGPERLWSNGCAVSR